MILKSLTSKEVQTKFGLKRKWIIKDEKGKMYDSWINQSNQDWKPGMTVDIKPEWIKSREWEGKLYYSIQLPRPNPSQEVIELLELVLKKLNNLNEKVEKLTNKNNFGGAAEKYKAGTISEDFGTIERGSWGDSQSF